VPVILPRKKQFGSERRLVGRRLDRICLSGYPATISARQTITMELNLFEIIQFLNFADTSVPLSIVR